MGLRQEIYNKNKKTYIKIGNNIDEVYNTYITDMNMTKLLALKKHNHSHYLKLLKILNHPVITKVVHIKN